MKGRPEGRLRIKKYCVSFDCFCGVVYDVEGGLLDGPNHDERVAFRVEITGDFL